MHYLNHSANRWFINLHQQACLALFYLCPVALNLLGCSSSSDHRILPFHAALLEESDKDMAVRGFLYKNYEGQWILSGTPNIKTCCLDNPDKAGPLLFLDQSFTPPSNTTHRTVVVQGRLKRRSASYYLENAALKKN